MKKIHATIGAVILLFFAANTPRAYAESEGPVTGPLTGPISSPEAGESAKLNPTGPLIGADNKVELNNERIRLLAAYLKSYNSPLAESAETFVLTAERYNLDWRLLPAISGIESTFGRRTAYRTNNPFGWGGGYISFVSWDSAIEHVGSKLRTNYMNKWGAETVEQIAPIYAPPSTTWARNVRYFMNDIENFEENRSKLALTL